MVTTSHIPIDAILPENCTFIVDRYYYTQESRPKCTGFQELFHNESYITEYGSTLYVGLARAVSPTNTNFRLTFLLTRLQEAL